MHIVLPITILFGFFIFLFTLYCLSYDDFILFRKHLTPERMFNMAFIVAFVSIFFARVFYVLFHFSSGFLNPLVFFLFPYFPGLSVAGGIIGGVLFLVFYCYGQKLPTERIFDFFAFSLFSAVPFALFILVITNKKIQISALAWGVIFFSIILFLSLLHIFKKQFLKEGSLGLLSLLGISLITFLFGFFGKTEQIIFFLNKDDFLLFAIFITCLTIFVRQENLIKKIRRV